MICCRMLRRRPIAARGVTDVCPSISIFSEKWPSEDRRNIAKYQKAASEQLKKEWYSVYILFFKKMVLTMGRGLLLVIFMTSLFGISTCRGTVSITPFLGFIQTEWLLPSRLKIHESTLISPSWCHFEALRPPWRERSDEKSLYYKHFRFLPSVEMTSLMLFGVSSYIHNGEGALIV